MNEFRRAILHNARTVARMSDADMQLLLPVLKDARAATARGIHKWLRAMKPDDAYTIAAHQQMLASLEDSIALMKRRLLPATRADLRSESVIAARESLVAMKAAAEMGAIKYQGSARPLRFNNAAIVASSDRALMMRHTSSAQRYAQRAGDDIRRQLAVGLVSGENIGQTVTRLMKKPAVLASRMSDGDIADTIAENSFFRSRADAERLVRTENNHAANRAQQEALEDENDEAEQGIRYTPTREDGDDDEDAVEGQDDTGGNREGGWLKRWDATFDSRTCEACADMDGEVREPDEEFAPGVMHPPLHPNCRCTIVPWREGWAL